MIYCVPNLSLNADKASINFIKKKGGRKFGGIQLDNHSPVMQRTVPPRASQPSFPFLKK